MKSIENPPKVVFDAEEGLNLKAHEEPPVKEGLIKKDISAEKLMHNLLILIRAFILHVSIGAAKREHKEPPPPEVEKIVVEKRCHFQMLYC